jgi:hypothetical protein
MFRTSTSIAVINSISGKADQVNLIYNLKHSWLIGQYPGNLMGLVMQKTVFGYPVTMIGQRTDIKLIAYGS